MRSILLSIKPQHVANILNYDKTVEIRKKFPKDYTGWIYIYCTKDKPKHSVIYRLCKKLHKTDFGCIGGKVVARFWCDIEEIKFNGYFSKSIFTTSTMSCEDLMFKSCLSRDDLVAYFDIPGCFKTSNLQPATCGNAIHISKLEIFNEPKELNQFLHLVECKNCKSECKSNPINIVGCVTPVEKAPQNYCYIEETEDREREA